jgi:hypothetical protein
MGPLHRSSPTPTTHDEDESEHLMPLMPVPDSADQRYNLHEAIEAVILFARALRAHN